jgi:hypothetical protein
MTATRTDHCADCARPARWISIVTVDMRLEPTDGPETQVHVRLYCPQDATGHMAEDSGDPLVLTATYKPIEPAL